MAPWKYCRDLTSSSTQDSVPKEILLCTRDMKSSARFFAVKSVFWKSSLRWRLKAPLPIAIRLLISLLEVPEWCAMLPRWIYSPTTEMACMPYSDTTWSRWPCWGPKYFCRSARDPWPRKVSRTSLLPFWRFGVTPWFMHVSKEYACR